MILNYFLYGLAFEVLGVAAYMQYRKEADFPLKKKLPWLAAFGLIGGASGWVEMLLITEASTGLGDILHVLRIILHPLSGILLLRFGWGVLHNLRPLPAWSIFIPGILIVPLSFVITYASSTFITPSPLEIPIDIWSRYLLYLPGSVMAGIGFLRQWEENRKEGLHDVSRLMLGAGIAFLIEAFVVGLIVPAAPHGPESYYNYDRVLHNAFVGESSEISSPYGLITYLDYESVRRTTGLSIEFWRTISAFILVFFVVKALDVFEAIRKRQIVALQGERDRARRLALETQTTARRSAENWSNSLVSISRRIAEFDHVDDVLMLITDSIRRLLNASFVGLALDNEQNSMLELKCYSSASKTEMVGPPPVIVTSPYIIDAFKMAQPFLSQKEEQVSFGDVSYFEEKDTKTLGIVPLIMENTPIGVLWIARFYDEVFTETDLIWLDSIADQVVIAIQHGLMMSRLQSLSIVEERSRIAREMHDGLAQVLGYLNLQTQTLGSLLNQGKKEALQNELDQMRKAVQTANEDVRENILSLRTTLSREKGFVSSVQEYLTEFSIQTGMETRFENRIEDNGSQLASVAEVQLVCIFQEALANARKHSNAERVTVELGKTDLSNNQHINLSIQDNGVGFTLLPSKLSFGLQTMRERAESVGGKLTVESQPGMGTRVECYIPCLKEEKLPKPSVVIK